MSAITRQCKTSKCSVSFSEYDSAVESDTDISDTDPDWKFTAVNNAPTTTRKRRRRPVMTSRRQTHSTSGASITTGRADARVTTGSCSSKKDRLLMRPWLEQQANFCLIPNMRWYDATKTKLRIPWKHGSRAGWTIDDCRLYKAWAEHTGKYTGSVDEPKKWKANFRCALNSLPDVREVKDLAHTRGKDPYMSTSS